VKTQKFVNIILCLQKYGNYYYSGDYFNEISKIIKNNTPPSRQTPDYDCIAIKGCDINSIIKVGRNGIYEVRIM